MQLILADSNDLVRVGIRSILKGKLDVEIVGEAKSNNDLLDMLHSFSAEVIVIDYTSPGFDIDVLLKIKSTYPEISILAITPEQSAQVLVDALRAGITSYVKKDCSIPEILEAVTETAQGNKFFCGQILETIQDANLDVEDIDDVFSCEAVIISKRECEIITLIAEGFTNQQIAEKLFLSSHTVNTHRKNIMAKLGVKNTAGIVMYAIKTNLTSPNKFLFTADNI
ncbi:MAG: response regulator transcription factor [Crocinitomicaceae bacterium]|jgi:DNA-binding NarL/FixJ family response regulator|nr:response regulator transcription factor [Crocinitomicaceae bacterium]MDP5098551.1 response regulator transcription factor [Crocinitomicaceae bacterium]